MTIWRYTPRLGNEVNQVTKEYGHYIDGGCDFCITEAEIPRNWYNYFWNDTYVSYISQAGFGESFAQDRLGRRLKLVEDRGFFIIEGDRSFGISGLPVEEKRDAYKCVHSHARSDIHTENYGLRSVVSIIVPRVGNFELWRVSVKNLTDCERSFKVLGFAKSAFDAVYTRQGYNTEASHYDGDLSGIYIEKRTSFDGMGGKAFGFLALDGATGYSGNYNSVIGPYGSVAYPVALRRGGLDNIDGCGEKLAFALEKGITLLPGEEKSMVFIAGIAGSLDEAREMKRLYADADYFESESAAVKDKFAKEENGVRISTPDPMLNNMLEWLKHATNLGSRWARVRHNGFRDMTSDTDCLAAFSPELALERFERILTYQYSNGYAPRTFIDGQIKPNNFADNTVWLNFTASSVIKELGRIDILDKEIPYNDGTVGTVYEHLSRSVEYLYNFTGHHGLVRIWGGDWNDCMNTAGIEGKGVSIWLSIAWYRANKVFAELAELYGRADDAKLAYERGEIMRDRIEEFGWDGEYYIDAINDNGVKIGSSECEEGKIFLIPQIWAVFSGVSRSGREITAMDSVEKYLNDPLGIKISAPPFTKYDSGIGAVTAKHPGIHENGGVYLHTIAWKIAADAMLGRTDKVEDGIKTILPFRNEVVDGRAEPYAMCNSYFGAETGYRYGTPGQSWRTAAGQWFAKAIVNYVFGLMPEMDGLRVSPCLPPSWKNPSVVKDFRGTRYNIRYDNKGARVSKILVDGQRIAGNILPSTGKETDVLVITE